MRVPALERREALPPPSSEVNFWKGTWEIVEVGTARGTRDIREVSSCSLGGAQKKASFWCGELGSVVRRCLQFHSVVTSACRHFLMGKNRPLAVQTPTEPPGQVQKPGTQPIGSPDTARHKHPVSGSPAGRPSRTYQLYCSKCSLWGHTPKPWKPQPV